MEHNQNTVANHQRAIRIKFHDHSWLFHQLLKKLAVIERLFGQLWTCFSGHCCCREVAVTERFNSLGPNIHVQIPQTENPRSKNELREFDKRSKRFLLGDHFINSHNLVSWHCMDIVRRKLMSCHYWNLKGKRQCMGCPLGQNNVAVSGGFTVLPIQIASLSMYNYYFTT